MKKISLIIACLGIISTAAMAQQPARQANGQRAQAQPAPRPNNAPAAQAASAPRPSAEPAPVVAQQDPAPASNTGAQKTAPANTKPLMRKMLVKQKPMPITNEEKIKKDQ